MKFLSTTEKILKNSIRDNTEKKYNVYWSQFVTYCEEQNIDINNVNIHQILDFLSKLFDRNLSISVIRAAKNAIAQHIHIPPYKKLSEHPLMNKYFKGLFNLRPPKQKFGFVWDVNIIFNYFRTLDDNQNLNDKELSYKLVILLLLLGGQRVNTIFWFTTDTMVINDLSITFAPHQVLKHSRPGRKLDVFEYRSYYDKKLCVVSCLKEYLSRRSVKVQNNTNKLLITYRKPYKEASVDTIRRWIKCVFNICGIYDFTPHSCRAASTSKAKFEGLDINFILKKACWDNENTFRTYYDKEIISEDTESMNVLLA